MNNNKFKIKVIKGNPNCRYHKKKGVFRLEEIVPRGLSLVTFHTAWPYCLVLEKGGWFKWMSNKNHVFAQNPESKEGEIIKIKKVGEKILVRLYDKKTNATIEKAVFSLKDLKFCPKVFDILFPHIKSRMCGSEKRSLIISCSNKDNPVKFVISRGKGKTTEICDLGLENKGVKVISMTMPCKYHKKKEGFSEKGISPLCPEVYHSAYPACLYLIYNSNKKEKIRIKCPGSKNYVLLEIEKTQKKFSRFIRSAQIVSRLVYPLDLIESRVFIRVVGMKGKCKKCKVGDNYEFNTGKFNSLCPAAFDSVYPSLVSSEGKNRKIKCPDCRACITYQVEK